MRVVVVGGTGNLGTALIDALEADDDVSDVTVVARRSAATTAAKANHVAADIARDDLDHVVAGADAVVHLAWLLQPTHQPTLTWRTNVVGSVRLFDAIVRQHVPQLFYASSVGAYSPVRGPAAPGRAADGGWADESWPTHSLPTTAYGREKAYLERVLDALEARHPQLRVVRMRPAFVFQRSAGAAQLRLFGGPLVPASLLRPGLLPVLPFPAGLRLQAVHASDVARAFLLALHDPAARGAYNLAADPVVDGGQLASLIGARVLPVAPRLVRAAMAAAWHGRVIAAEPALFDLAMGLPLMRTDRARTELRWVPETSSTAALAEGIEGMREKAAGPTAPLAPDPPLARLAVAARIRSRSTG